MYICYVDESGTPDLPGNTSHFVLAAISIPIWHWRDADYQVATIMKQYGLEEKELHTAWILRKYLEQSRIPDFDRMSWHTRRAAAERERNAHLLALQRSGNRKSYQQQKKTFTHTNAYLHLTLADRTSLIQEVADCVAGWGFARLFAECIDKLHFNEARAGCTVDEQAFEQVVSRFEQFLVNTEDTGGQKNFGLLVHDNNQTVARKHTQLMRDFHRKGTLWTKVKRLIETPLFVDSSLTGMVQVADLCSYALRRYLENSETDLFSRLFVRADRARGTVVGVRHYTTMNCACDICRAHRRP